MEVLEQAGATGIQDLPREADGAGRAAGVNRLMLGLRSAFVSDPGLGARVRAVLAGDGGQTALTVEERRLITGLTSLYEGADNRYLNFYGPPGSIPNIPYNAVLGSDAAKISPAELDLAGKVVFVGL